MPTRSRPPLREVLRFLLYAGPMAVVAVIGFLVYQHFTAKDRVIAEQKRVIKELGQRLDRAWAEELVADLRVDGIDKDASTGQRLMHLTFVQYQPGTEVPTVQRAMTLPGDEVYLDALVVQFDRELVEAGDGTRGKSLLLFRRAFGDRQQPVEGASLYNSDDRSLVPAAVAVDAAPSDFEKNLWSRFWYYANDPKLAAAQGIRIAQGEAPHVRVIPGQVYKLTLRRSGGLQITPRLPAAVLEH